MKYFDWDPLKSLLLKDQRGISFEDVLAAIDDGKVLDDIQHPNKRKYPHQRLLVIEINNYAYLIPYVEDDVKVFLKTVIPSRKATKKYLKESNNE